LVYTPVNLSFGGNPFNSSHLLAIAEIDRPDPPPSSSSFGSDRTESTQTSFFVRQLESRILSRLSLDITNAIFGDDAEPSGEFTFADTTLTFETLLDGTIVVEIIDTTTGNTTTIEVPAFLTGSN
jgi:curli production assembly/transport component CsgF